MAINPLNKKIKKAELRVRLFYLTSKSYIAIIKPQDNLYHLFPVYYYLIIHIWIIKKRKFNNYCYLPSYLVFNSKILS